MRSWSSHKIFPSPHRGKHSRPEYFGLHSIVMPKRGFAWGRTKMFCPPIPAAATSSVSKYLQTKKAWWRNLDGNNLDSLNTHANSHIHGHQVQGILKLFTSAGTALESMERESCDGVAGRTGHSLNIWRGKCLEIGDGNYLFTQQFQCWQH